MKDLSAYGELEIIFCQIFTLKGIESFLYWDMSVNMPIGGAMVRSEQLAVLTEKIHSIITSKQVGSLLNESEISPPSDPWRRANLREMRRYWKHAIFVDGKLVQALSKSSSACQMAWRKACQENDFGLVKDSFSKLLGLVREKAVTKGSGFGKLPYEALMDEFEPDSTIKELDSIFCELYEFLPELTEKVVFKQSVGKPPEIPIGPFDEEAQINLARFMMKQVGFNFEYGRLDKSLHPFCGGVSEDVRITTRYKKNDFLSGLMGVLHETGHAMYERGLPEKWRHQPVGQARGMAIHESQSLLIEMQVCRSLEFLSFAVPLMKTAFGSKGSAWTPGNFYRLQNKVSKSLIRVEADEVTYPLHVILRYQIEKALISGEIEVEELPAIWNEKMRNFLGVEPKNDREGCLQDIHWFNGAFGYFPTYTLGALAAAQIFQAACTAETEIKPKLSEGCFVPLMRWLRENIHSKGSSASTNEILTGASGSPIGTKAFKLHLQQQYLE